MQIHRIDLNLLAVFECIYSQGSVTRAAELLHLTQPSVSHALNRLRETLGDPLFVRDGKQLTPTPKAQELISPIRNALNEIEQTLNRSEQFQPLEAAREFSIGMRPIMESAYFPKLRRELKEAAPNSNISAVPFRREQLASELVRGDIQLAMDVFLQLPETIARAPLVRSPIVVVGRADHPALKQGSFKIDTYLKQAHILVSSRQQGSGLEDMLLAREGKSRVIETRCQQITTALDIVSQSDLLLTVAKTLVAPQLTTAHTMVTAPFNAPEVETYLYWHKKSELDPANQWLREQLQGIFK